MERAEYPQRTCREPVAGTYQMYTCEIAELHKGPCASLSSPASVAARDRWEKSQAALAAKAAPKPRGRRKVDAP